MPGIKRDVLERPFDPSVIRTRKGPHGPINYVEGAEIIRRLNEAFESAWDFIIVEREVRDAEVVVLAKLTANGVTKMAFGGSGITTTRDSGAVVSLADDLKASATDALKKCATMFGVGLHLYSDTQPQVAPPLRTASALPGRPGNGNGHAGPGPGNGAAHGGAGGNGGGPSRAAAATPPDRLTQKQLSAVWALARRLGFTTEDLRQRCTATFGVLPEYLSRADGSTFIGELQAEAAPAGMEGSP